MRRLWRPNALLRKVVAAWNLHAESPVPLELLSRELLGAPVCRELLHARVVEGWECDRRDVLCPHCHCAPHLLSSRS